jgi:protein CpxP
MREVSSATVSRTSVPTLARVLAAGVLTVAAAIALMPGAHAQGVHGPDMGGAGTRLFGGPPEHVARRMDHLLDGLGATDVQRSQIKQIALGAATDLRVEVGRGRLVRERGMQIFSAPVVDASAAESLRQETLAQQDQASKRVLQAMLDIAKVLTPEQRAKIGDRLRQRQAIMQDRMRREQRERPAK